MEFQESGLYIRLKRVVRLGIYLSIFYGFIFAPVWNLLLSHFQAEATIGLGAIYGAERMCYQKHGDFCDDFSDLILKFDEYGRYSFFLSPTEYQGKPIEDLGLSVPINFKKLGVPTPGLTEDGYIAVAIGNVDLDKDLDVWCINQDGKIINPKSDVYRYWLAIITFVNS
jgi:hypothetical protein